jgi:hypothetical protein
MLGTITIIKMTLDILTLSILTHWNTTLSMMTSSIAKALSIMTNNRQLNIMTRSITTYGMPRLRITMLGTITIITMTFDI